MGDDAAHSENNCTESLEILTKKRGKSRALFTD